MITAERISDRDEIKSLFRVRPSFKAIESEIIDMVSTSGAILKGHFQLESDLHSNYFFRFADLSSRLDFIDLLSNALIGILYSDRIDFDAIFVQPSSGRLLARALSKKMEKKLIVAKVNEKNQPTGEIINEVDLHPNDRVLLFEDLATTGSSLKIMVRALLERRAKPVAIALFATRNEKEMNKFANEQNLPLIVMGDLAFEKGTIDKANCLDCPQKTILSWEV